MRSSTRRFQVRYGLWRPLLSVFGLGPAFTFIEVDEQTLRVKMGWGFRTEVPLTSVRSARRSGNRWAGIGIHGMGGRWLVNGSVAGMVRIEVDPPAVARVLGFRVRLRVLEVSLEDPDGFVADMEAYAS